MIDTNEALSRTILLCRDFVPTNVSDDEIVRALRATNVALVADAENLKSGACQSSVVTLVHQLVATGISVRFVGPDTPLAVRQPPWTAATLYGVLDEIRADSVPAASVLIGGPRSRDELAFAFGDTLVDLEVGWRVWGSLWAGGIASPGSAAPRWRGDFPIGGLAAATVAAVEPFKAAVRAMGALADVEEEQLRPVIEGSIRLAPETMPTIANIGSVDCVSGGAIIQAALHALLRVPGIVGDVRVFEPEVLDLSNLNRYGLGRRSRLHQPKVEALGACSTETFRIYGVRARFDAELSETVTLAPSVLVGTDNLPSRWLVQRRWPAWLCVGATSHFEAMVSEHETALNSGCAGCAHPTDDGVVATIPTVSFVSYWAGLMVATRLLRHLAGIRCDVDEQALSLFALRLDSRHGQWRRPVHLAEGCPVMRHAA